MGILRLTHRYLVRQTMPASAVDYYDRLINSVAEFYLRPLCNDILEAFPSTAAILDIGAGTGQLAIMLAQANPQYRITAVDLSEPCLRVARRRAEDAGLSSRVEFACIDLEKNAHSLPPADLIVSTCSLHHWRHPVRILRAASRLLKPSGEIWIMDDFGSASDTTRRAWVDRIERAARAGLLFRSVFWFESRFLAYTQNEIEKLCANADLRLNDFACRDVFFIARLSRM